MKKIYTCFACGFPTVFDEAAVPAQCPGCGAPRSQFLEEPWNGSIEARRIRVDPPAHDTDRDPLDLSFHIAKPFHDTHGAGRLRRWIMYYDNPAETRTYYEDVLGWDIVRTEKSTDEEPVFYCVTGPATDDWEPRAASMGFGFIKPKPAEGEPMPRYIIEVKNLEDTFPRIEEFGGKVLRARHSIEGEAYALIEDPEGNTFYIWEVPLGSLI